MPIHFQYIFHLSSYHIYPFKCCSCVSTFKRKRAIADREGAQAKYLEKVVAPDKSNSPLGVVAISPDPQNTPTLADSSPTTLVISDAPTQQTPTAANSMIMPVDIALAVRRKTPIPAKSTPNPVAKSLF